MLNFFLEALTLLQYLFSYPIKIKRIQAIKIVIQDYVNEIYLCGEIPTLVCHNNNSVQCTIGFLGCNVHISTYHSLFLASCCAVLMFILHISPD